MQGDFDLVWGEVSRWAGGGTEADVQNLAGSRWAFLEAAAAREATRVTLRSADSKWNSERPKLLARITVLS